MENVARKITIHSKEVRKDKQTFIASSALINGAWFKIKFVKGCNDKPEEKGMYDITFNTDNCSVERGRAYTKKDGGVGYENDTIWIKKLETIYKYTDEDMKEMNRVTVSSIFGE